MRAQPAPAGRDAEAVLRRPGLLFVCDEAGRLALVNEPWEPKRPAPVAYVCCGAGTLAHAVRRDVSEAAARRVGGALDAIARLRAPQPRSVEAALRDALQGYLPARTVFRGLVYRFPPDLPRAAGVVVVGSSNSGVLEGRFDDMVAELDSAQPFVAKLEEGRAVAVCRTVRRSRSGVEAGAEAGVATHPDFRNRGHGTDVVAAWASLSRREGATPYYSTAQDNLASRALAARLGLVAFAFDLSLA